MASGICQAARVGGLQGRGHPWLTKAWERQPPYAYWSGLLSLLLEESHRESNPIYLVQLASGGVALPVRDATGTANLAVTGGKVALVDDATSVSCGVA